MSTEKSTMIAIPAQVEVCAAEKQDDGSSKPARFTSQFYTGGPLDIAGWDLPVVIDLAGLEVGNVLVANLDHDSSKRVGNFEVENDGKGLTAHGTATASTPARDEVVHSARDGYQWQASLEVRPRQVEELKAGASAEVNGRQIEGPAYITRKGILKGFAFVSHGADDNTSVNIAATAALNPEKKMENKFREWAQDMLPGVDLESLNAQALANLEANYNGRNGTPTPLTTQPAESLGDIVAQKKAERARLEEIVDITAKACDARPFDIDAIKSLADHAMEAKWSVDKFRLELLEASTPVSHTVFNTRGVENRVNNKVIEAAICIAGRLPDHEKAFDDQTLQTAHDRFRNGIGLRQLFCLAAEANGYKPMGYDVTIEVQRAAFGMLPTREIRAQGFSSISLSNILSSSTNRFLRVGWNAVDSTWRAIAAIRPVNDFKTITTVSLTGDMEFEKIGADGELHHARLGEETYSNKADTYGKMLAITRTDLINDDLGALTSVPMKLGRGGALKLNDIFWAAFLNNSSFFSVANGNVSTDTGALSLLGLEQAESKFALQTDPDGKPIAVMPRILLVPTALRATAQSLMESERLITTGSTASTLGDANIYRGRFQIESSPYMQNSSYTGYSPSAWYLLADPGEMPVIEIAALFGRVEPIIETADADFNVLGVQMRGYSDVGVALQEPRGGVRADGSAAG